jgi:hypothetical protein
MKSFLCHFNRIRLNEKSRVSFLPFAATSQKASLVFDLSRGFKEKRDDTAPFPSRGKVWPILETPFLKRKALP